MIPASMGLCAIEAVDAKRRMARQHIKIAVAVKYLRGHADRNRGNETVNQSADGLSPATAKAVEGGRFLIVRRSGRSGPRPREQSPEVPQMPLVLGSGKDLHANGVTDGDVLLKDLSDTVTYR